MHPVLDMVDRLLVDSLAHEDREAALAIMVTVDHLDDTLSIAAASLLAAAFLSPEHGDIRWVVIQQFAGKLFLTGFEQRLVDDIDLGDVALTDPGST